MKCLLLDVGSTFIKYSVYDNRTCKVICSDKEPFPEPSECVRGRFCVHRDKIDRIITQLFEYASKEGCNAAFISVQMHGYIVKTKSGELSDYVSWRDRSGDVSDKAISQMNFDLLGTSLKDNLPLVKLAQARDVSEFFTLGSYIMWRLTKNNATHITDACASGFFYSENGEYNGYLKDALMPKVYTDISVVGYSGNIAVYAPMGDHQVSFLGSGVRRDSFFLNIGTASQLTCTVDADHHSGMYEKRPYFERGVRLCTVSGLVGGDSLFSGEGEAKLLCQVSEALDSLEKKRSVLLGGGGAAKIYDKLKSMLLCRGMDCVLIDKNVGMEGLRLIADRVRIRAGTMLSEVPFVNFPIIVKNSGLDFLMIDCEHGAFDPSVISGIIMNSNLIGLDTVIRLPSNSRENIIKLADAGARGFLLPMANTKEDIATVVRYAKYSPVGERGISTTRAHTLYDPPSLIEYKKEANEKMRVYAQIETACGVENVEEILSVKGVDGVFVGPNDLSDDLGCIGDKEPIYKCIDRVSCAAKSMGKTWGIITADRELIEYAKKCGVSAISMGSELNMLINGCKKLKESI